MPKLTKTQQAAAALVEAHPISNRGHAFKVLEVKGLTGSGAVFNGAIKMYQERFDLVLGKSAAAVRETRDSDLRAVAHQMSADDVKQHIEDIDRADPLFWACWKVFRHEGKFSNLLSTGDFAVHFNN